MGTQNSSDLSSCGTNTLCFSGPSALTLCFFFFWNIFFCAALVFFFRLLFKSLFSFCLKKMVRSIIDKGGVSRERVVVKDSNDFSRLSGHWSRSVIFTLTATNYLKIFSILSKCWDTLVPSCILLGKNRCRRNFMFTIVTDSYILCGVSQIYHADSMSPTETSTLSLTTIRLAQLRRTFFLLSTTMDAVHMLSFVVWLQQHQLDWRSH